MYEKIKELAKKRGISINQLELNLGIARGSLCKIDKNKPSGTKLMMIADSLGVSLSYLLGEEESELSDSKYYINEDTAEVAQQIFENKDMQLLFKVARGEKAESLINYAKKLEELRKMEEGDM
jgi:transcriptional regulator with XRE-family HTH domain